MRIDAIAVGLHPPDDINVIIEVPVGGEPIKYELDKEAGTLVVDRFLYTPMRVSRQLRLRAAYPLCGDGDPLDVLVSFDAGAGAGLRHQYAGRSACWSMEDEAGTDEKILAVPRRHS